MRIDHVQQGVGHYGVFNGKRFRTEIYPRMREFMRAFQSANARGAGAGPVAKRGRKAEAA
jgi:poly(3-hydroxybutyrate) depolymerase